MKKTLLLMAASAVAFAQTVLSSFTPQVAYAGMAESPQTFGTRFVENFADAKTAMGLDTVRRNDAMISQLTGQNTFRGSDKHLTSATMTSASNVRVTSAHSRC